MNPTLTIPSLSGTSRFGAFKFSQKRKSGEIPDREEPSSPSLSNTRVEKQCVKYETNRLESNKARHTTPWITHLAVSANFKGVTSNKLCSGLTCLYFESPNNTVHVTDPGLGGRHNFQILMKIPKPKIYDD
jgi:hypothetical protein